ncbi:peptidase [Shimia sagamensis]|uniref:Phage cell wall peptidase, NlpC/P60 family n=1 Tax=Shimia sagamensis TaxID=1566352 RepID=A0ABY1NKF7_9RHOB|nr:peptidase [Shimia sagamensis]SMP11368.1 putative phage cell wall peptidase, NlpC/P60 family [Shimia sagamensis]
MRESCGRRAVVEARRWIGTPYVHQASCKGAGTDCLGLIRGVWREMYGAEPENVPAYTQDWSEAHGTEVLWAGAMRNLLAKDPTDESCGDILLFRMASGAVAKHLGIAGKVGPEATVIHAYCGHAVIESPLSAPWRRRIVARFQFPDHV